MLLVAAEEAVPVQTEETPPRAEMRETAEAADTDSDTDYRSDGFETESVATET